MYTQPFSAPTATCVPPVPSRLLPTADPENTSLVAGGGGKLIGDDDPDTGVRVMPPTAASRAAARLEAGAAPAEETRSATLRTTTNSRRDDCARGFAACVVRVLVVMSVVPRCPARPAPAWCCHRHLDRWA